MTEALLEINDLSVTFPTAAGDVKSVRGVSFSVGAGEALAIVGESGAGKSVSMMAVLGLVPGARVSGSARYRGTELLGLAPNRLRELRGAHIAMVFQDPMTSLNPVMTVGSQIGAVLRAHDRRLSRKAARARAAELLQLVAIPQPDRRVRAYPHELSGGMRQRVMIAMAVSNGPDVLICDEPTTALDVTVQAQILEVIGRLREEQDIALVLITHDLGVVAGTVDRVAIMYAGRVVEEGALATVFGAPRHPYTRGLLASLPRLDRRADPTPIGGIPPSPLTLPSGCPFHPRCPLAEAMCEVIEPDLEPLSGGMVACHVAMARGRVGNGAS
ncbi:MAG: glutathione transport system ATP-binding protein [Acidimicrobiaceae bacterium]|nr:glutathione transport system ATP-binding protein [Acidimicrobiaceae bacterium]